MSKVERYWVTMMLPRNQMNETVYALIDTVMAEKPTGTLYLDGSYDLDWTDFKTPKRAIRTARILHELGIEGAMVFAKDTDRDPQVLRTFGTWPDP